MSAFKFKDGSDMGAERWLLQEQARRLVADAAGMWTEWRWTAPVEGEFRIEGVQSALRIVLTVEDKPYPPCYRHTYTAQLFEGDSLVHEIADGASSIPLSAMVWHVRNGGREPEEGTR